MTMLEKKKFWQRWTLILCAISFGWALVLSWLAEHDIPATWDIWTSSFALVFSTYFCLCLASQYEYKFRKQGPEEEHF